MVTGCAPTGIAAPGRVRDRAAGVERAARPDPSGARRRGGAPEGTTSRLFRTRAALLISEIAQRSDQSAERRRENAARASAMDWTSAVSSSDARRSAIQVRASAAASRGARCAGGTRRRSPAAFRERPLRWHALIATALGDRAPAIGPRAKSGECRQLMPGDENDLTVRCRHDRQGAWDIWTSRRSTTGLPTVGRC